MLTDSEKKTMRDSVRGMPLAQAAALPIYDDFCHFRTSGLPGNEYAALLDGAVAGTQSDAQARLQAYRDDRNEKMGQSWQPANTNQDAAPIPQYTKDGRHISTLTDRELAYHRHVSELNSEWRR
jgi:hypothetical protein